MFMKLLRCASIMLVLGALASAQTLVRGVAAAEEQPATVTICQLKSDPAAYNHKLVEVTGFVSHAFEDFTVFDPTCPSWPGVWLPGIYIRSPAYLTREYSNGWEIASAADLYSQIYLNPWH
jgi:hypothetical protein